MESRALAGKGPLGMKEYEERLLRLMNLMERMVDMQDRMVNQIEMLSKEVDDLRARVDEQNPQETVAFSRLN